MNIKKGDKVKVIYGSQRGKTGTVEKVLAAQNLVYVVGVNLVKKNIKSQGVIELPRPLTVSKLILICPKCQVETKAQSKNENGKKVRICKMCQAPL